MDHSSPEDFAPRPRHNAWRCDIFCTVIDNFGDAGVCLRLARQLAAEHGWAVRLWTDRLDVLQRFLPTLLLHLPEQMIAGIRIAFWAPDAPVAADEEVPEIVIEAFGCRLPARLVARMAERKPAPVWINLEYLSAEEWIETCHGLPSPDPATGLVKHFFFPGFTSCGGLLREEMLDELVNDFSDQAVQCAFLSSLGIGIETNEVPVSLFCYQESPVDRLVEAWRGSPVRVHCMAPSSLAPDILRTLQNAASENAIGLSFLPFLPQQDYDKLLLSCAINFVRGEDSFVRAQWARRPFVWQPYPQEGGAHMAKLASFLDVYLANAGDDVSATVRPLFMAWSGSGDIDPKKWRRLERQKAEVAAHNEAWASHLKSYGDLASHLAAFCRSRL